MITGDLETGAAIEAGEVNTEQLAMTHVFTKLCIYLTCWLEIGVVDAGHADPQLLPLGQPRHVLLSDPTDPGVHAGDEALHPRHEADARVLAIEAQQEPVTLALS